MNEVLIYYFKLQYLRFKRKCEELQIHPLFVLIIGGVAFTIASSFLFYKTSLAQWLYPIIGLGFIISYSSKITQNDFQSIFTLQDLRLIKILQSFLLALPFIVFLAFKNLLLQSLLLTLLTLALSFISPKSRFSLKIPTPFKKMPFEFIVGFRRNILLILLAYFLLFKGIQVANQNLAFSTLGFLLLLSMSFYARPEVPYFVWIYSKSPQQFLLSKIKTALLSASLLALPALSTLIIFYFSQFYIVLFILLAGLLYLVSMVLAKYAAFPDEMSLPQAIILGFSFVFPPLLLYTIPAFYRKSIQNLTSILTC